MDCKLTTASQLLTGPTAETTASAAAVAKTTAVAVEATVPAVTVTAVTPTAVVEMAAVETAVEEMVLAADCAGRDGADGAGAGGDGGGGEERTQGGAPRASGICKQANDTLDVKTAPLRRSQEWP